jgi:hypothetical protein
MTKQNNTIASSHTMEGKYITDENKYKQWLLCLKQKALPEVIKYS